MKARLLSLLCLACAIGLLPAARDPMARSAGTPVLQVIGPGNAEEPLLALLAAARQRILVETFALSDPGLIAALESAQRRGVDVRAVLDPQGLNYDTTVATLNGAGTRTRTPNPAYGVTHMDSIVVDASAVAVLTAAPTALALGPLGSAYAVIDRDRADVVQAASLFYDDWLRRPVSLFGHNLIVLPDDAGRIAALIGAARQRLELYTSYLSDPSVVAALRAARGRGVPVRVLTPRSSFNVALNLVGQPGEVRFGDAGAGTALVIDRRIALLGSMDLTTYTLTAHRELGVVVADGAAVTALDRTFFSQFDRAAILPLAPARKRQPGKKPVATGALPLTADVSPVVRPGGEAAVAITTQAGARVDITILYPTGSRPAIGTTGASGHADKRGNFVYRWIVSGVVKAGAARVHIAARLGARSAALTTTFTVAGSQ